MNIAFKSEFKSLSPDEIKAIINGCAGTEILEHDITQNPHNDDGKYYIKYIDDEKYGFWTVQWGWKKPTSSPNIVSTGGFQYSIKITPFKTEFENTTIFNPFCKHHCRKGVEEYMALYINKKCPHYKQAIMEEAQNFINFLGPSSDDEAIK